MSFDKVSEAQGKMKTNHISSGLDHVGLPEYRSPRIAAKRIEKAKAVFGEAVLRRIIAFTLFILGFKREDIAETLKMPLGTVQSQVQRILKDGVEGVIDHRCKAAPDVEFCLPKPQPTPAVYVNQEAGALVIGDVQLQLREDNQAQRMVVLLSLIGEDMLSAKDVAPILGLSVPHVRRLHRNLMDSDVEAVLDKRRGQVQDYRIGSDLKGQMIVHFVLELAEAGKASGAAVARRLGLHCDEQVSERTIRHHLRRMGLTQAKELLVAGLRDIKRGSGR
jgi:transposase